VARPTACVMCGEPLPADAGNRRRYCGTTCRREAEFEIRRANGLLYRAEKRLQDFALGTVRIYDARQLKQRREECAAEVERLRERLRALLSTDTED